MDIKMTSNSYRTTINKNKTDWEEFYKSQSGLTKIVLGSEEQISASPTGTDIYKKVKDQPGPSKQDRNAYKKYIFREDYSDEFDAFHKYFTWIRVNGLFDKISSDVENMREQCDLYNDVMMTYKSQNLNMTCDETLDTKNTDLLCASDSVKLRTSNSYRTTINKNKTDWEEFYKSQSGLTKIVLGSEEQISASPTGTDIYKKVKDQPGPSKQDRNAYKKYIFREDYSDEFDAFHKYFTWIRVNGLFDKISSDVENMREQCDLYNDVMMTYKSQNLNMTCDETLDTKNTDLLCASDSVKLRTSSEKGRHLEASKDIPAGAPLVIEKPVILQVAPFCKCVGDPDTSLYKCHHCGLSIGDFYSCMKCNICVFCSKSCLQNAQKDYHEYECYALQRHFWSIYDNSDFSYLSLRIMLYGASQTFNHKPRTNPHFRYDKNSYPFIYNLETHFDKMSKDQVNKILYVLYLLNKTQFFNNSRNLMKQSKNSMDFVSFIGGLMVKHYCQAQINNINLVFPNLLVVNGLYSMSGYGKAICPTISMINHSCTPNAVILLYSTFLVVKSLVPIKKGEEITISYSEINTFMTLEERIMVAQYFFFFRCKCSLCESERNAMQDQYKCPVCHSCNVKQIENVDGKVVGSCPKCEKTVSMSTSVNQLNLINKYRDLYSNTNDLDYLTKIVACYKTIILRNSIHMLDIYQVLYNKYGNGVDQLQALKYGLLVFEILEENISKLHFPLLSAKFLFLIKMSAIELPSQITEEEIEIIKLYVSAALRIKQDLSFYLPIENITDYLLIQKQIIRIMDQIKYQRRMER